MSALNLLRGACRNGRLAFKCTKSNSCAHLGLKIRHQQCRLLYTPNDAVQKQGSYEGPGKTTVAILNEDSAGFVNMIDSYAVDGFRLNDDTKILGPCVIFPTQIFGNIIDCVRSLIYLF